ncbi:glycosyltransferase family 2 protein [Pseudomonas sp. Marseille-QA0892]
MNAFEASEPLHGAIDGMRGDVLQGWAIDRRDPGLRLAVEVYIDHVFVALARADREQPFDSAGDGFHGFAVQLRPAWLENAKQVAVRIANGGPWLDGALERPFGEQRDNVTAIASQVWHTGGLKIKGWAWDPASPPRHVSVSAREGLHHIASGIANRLHPALIDRTTADHGFDIDLPWALADGCLHTIHIETDEGIPVTGSPIQLCVHPEGLAALVQKFWPSTAEHDERSEEVPALLTQLAETCDLHAPRSAGFSHYPRWHAVFQQPAPIQPVDGVTLVILLGNGTSEAWAATRLSIEQQRLPAEQIRVIAPQDADLFTEVTQHLGAARIIVPVRVGDRLAGHALDTCLSVLNQSCAAWAYSDCDQDDSQGRRTNPWFKPCWDETLFYGMDIVSSGGAFSSLAIAEALQRLAPLAQEASLGWHWLLAGVVAANDARVVHIPAVLYHRAADAPATPYSSLPDSRRHASLTWLAQQRMAGAVVDAHPSYPGLSRAIWPLPNALPVISLIVPTRDHVELLRACIEGLAARTDYPALEIIVVDNGSRLPETLEYLQRIA